MKIFKRAALLVLLIVALVFGTRTYKKLTENPYAAIPPLTLGQVKKQPGLVKEEFIFTTAPFPSCHAATIVQAQSGLVAAWFGGTEEQNPDTGIWLSRQIKNQWTKPVEVANGIQADGTRQPSWNPVLFQPSQGPQKGQVLLFYKVGSSPRHWWGELKISKDSGQTWGAAQRLPSGILGPIKNQPVQLKDGTLLCPSSTEKPITKEWQVHFESTKDGGKTWQSVTPAPNPDSGVSAIQPSILFHKNGKLQAVGRTHNQRIFETWSSDNGASWSPITLTNMPNSNSGIAAITLRDGRQLLVYNHNTVRNGRSPLNVAVSRDGKLWEAALVLEIEPAEFSYPSAIQTSDGLVHIVYTWKRERIKHVVLNPAKLKTVPMPDGHWPGMKS